MKLSQSLPAEAKRKLWRKYYEGKLDKLDEEVSQSKVERRMSSELGISTQTIRNYRKSESCPQARVVNRILNILPLSKALEILLPEIDSFIQDIIDLMASKDLPAPSENEDSNQLSENLDRLEDKVGRMKIDIWLKNHKKVKEAGIDEEFSSLLESAHMFERVISGTKADLGKRAEKEFSEAFLDKAVEYFGVIIEEYFTTPNRQDWEVVPKNLNETVSNLANSANELLFDREDNVMAEDYKNYEGEDKEKVFAQRLYVAACIAGVILMKIESIDLEEISSDEFDENEDVLNSVDLEELGISPDQMPDSTTESLPFSSKSYEKKVFKELDKRRKKLKENYIEKLANRLEEMDDDEMKSVLNSLKEEVKDDSEE